MRDGDVIYYQCENTGPGGMMTHVGRYYVLGKEPQELADAFGIICEAQDNTVRMLQPGASCREIFAGTTPSWKSTGCTRSRGCIAMARAMTWSSGRWFATTKTWRSAPA